MIECVSLSLSSWPRDDPCASEMYKRLWRMLLAAQRQSACRSSHHSFMVAINMFVSGIFCSSTRHRSVGGGLVLCRSVFLRVWLSLFHGLTRGPFLLFVLEIAGGKG